MKITALFLCSDKFNLFKESIKMYLKKFSLLLEIGKFYFNLNEVHVIAIIFSAFCQGCFLYSLGFLTTLLTQQIYYINKKKVTALETMFRCYMRACHKTIFLLCKKKFPVLIFNDQYPVVPFYINDGIFFSFFQHTEVPMHLSRVSVSRVLPKRRNVR